MGMPFSYILEDFKQWEQRSPRNDHWSSDCNAVIATAVIYASICVKICICQKIAVCKHLGGVTCKLDFNKLWMHLFLLVSHKLWSFVNLSLIYGSL